MSVMRRLWIGFVIALVCSSPLVVRAQTATFTKNDVEYALELPSPAWQVVTRLDVHDHLEFIYGDETTKGYLHLRKILVDPGITAVDLFLADEKWHFQRLPGYVVCSECNGENFEGHYTGASFSYEYVSGGKPMAGRVYYLQIDKRTFYSLRFTAARDSFAEIREQMDFIARSFRLK